MNQFKSILFAACAAVALVGCGAKNEKAISEDTAEKVKVQQLKSIEISRDIEYNSILQGYETMNVAPALQGAIEKIFVEIGDNVRKGDMLVRMAQTQLNTTKIAFANLQIELDRMTSLKESGNISQQAYDQMKLNYDQTKVNLEFLEKNTFVKAEFDGVISAKNYEDGELFAGQPIVELTQLSKLKSLVSIPETYFPHVKKGSKLIVMSDVYPTDTFGAVVETVYPTIDATTHNFRIELQIPNPTRKLRPGMYVSSIISLGKSDAMIVPYQSVLKLVGSNNRYVYINDNGVAKYIPVELGTRFDDLIEIISPELESGMELIVVGQAKLVDGAKIVVVE